jgi:chaperone modulatory protein CbpM
MPAVVELVELGVVVSRGASPEEWLVPATSLSRLRVAGRLIRDLGVNVTGAALVVELLESRGELERRIGRLERLVYE